MYVKATVTPRSGVPANPQPHGVKSALEKMDRSRDPNVWLGGRIADAEAAQAAGVRFAWARYGYETDAPSEPDKVLRRFEDILAL